MGETSQPAGCAAGESIPREREAGPVGLAPEGPLSTKALTARLPRGAAGGSPRGERLPLAAAF